MQNKKILSVILSVSIVFVSLFSQSFSVLTKATNEYTDVPIIEIESGDCGDNCTWSITNDGTLNIVGIGATNNYSLPMATPWYKHSENIIKIEIADSITHIGNNCFSSLTKLEEVIINNPNTTFGLYAFEEDTIAIIKAAENSAVEKYAKENNITFVKLPNAETPENPILESYSGHSIMLKTIEGYEYSLDGFSWQNSSVFNNLPYNVILNFYTRIAANDTDAASPPSEAFKCIIISDPTVFVGETSIHIKPIEGFEYSLGYDIWQESNVFDKYIVPNETYTVYQRLKNADSVTVLDTSTGTTVTVNGNEMIENPDVSHLVLLKKALLLNTHNRNISIDFNGDFEINIIDFIALNKCLVDNDSADDNITDDDPAVTPTGGNYVNVGSGLIAEIVHTTAETFDAYSTNDWSSPVNNYLPKGTVDYVSSSRVYYSSGSSRKEYAVLRYGKQVYTSIKDNPGGSNIQIIKEYAGTLPDHNEIKLAAMSEDGRFTTFTFDCLFKAPFNFNIPQNYANPSRQDYSVSSFTANYVDIVFCYATVFEGEIAISDTNPLFKSAEIIKNPSGADHTLRLHLRKAGGFYGWDAKYNSQGQLVFEFLHPAKITSAENSYGVDLTGITILIDAGHNGTGVDPGALGLNSKNHEAERNLNLAKKLKAELEKMGATVVMTRDAEVSSITYQQRIQKFKELKPDFCISIHHNSSTSSRPKGFVAYYGTPFSKNATEFISDRTFNKAVYSEIDPFGWHYFFLARVTNCPVVLTENGYMSNSEDFSGIIDENKNTLKAIAMAEGIVDYFKSIQ